MTYPNNILSGAFNRAPASAVKYLSKKVSSSSFDWWEVLEQSHEKAFVVSKAAQGDVLTSIRDALEKAQQNGETFEKFQKNLEPTLRRLGWWGKNANGDILGTPYRLKNIFATNIQQSFNAGREKSIRNRPELRPFAEYIAILDSRTRPSHGRLDGIVCPVHDPFWSYYTPSNGYRCRCRKKSLSERAVRRRGLTVESFEGRIDYEDQFVNKKKGVTKRVAVVNIDGQAVSPDPGFSSNPISKYTPDLEKYPPKIRADLKKDLRKAQAAGKAGARRESSISRAKKWITGKRKPKDFDASLKKSEKFLKPWTKDFETIKAQRDGKTDVFTFEDGTSIATGNVALANKLQNALKKRSFTSQAKAINEARKGITEGDQIEAIDFFSEQLAKKARKAQTAAVDKAVPVFKDIEIGKKIRIGEDYFPNTRTTSEPYLRGVTKYETASEQLAELRSDRAKKNLSEKVRLSMVSQIEEQIDEFVKVKGNFLGGDLQDAKLPSRLDPTLRTPKITKSAADEKGIGRARTEFKRRAKRAAEFFRRNLASEMHVDEDIAGYTLKYGVGGSAYSMNSRKISLDLRQGDDTFVHEMGHHFHDKNPRIGRMIEEFFRRRCKGEKIESSNKYLNMDFLRDNFSDDYIGRVYGGGLPKWDKPDGTFDFDKYAKSETGLNFQLGTETFTRGIQYFFNERADFYARDPEFFELILAILRGEVPE